MLALSFLPPHAVAATQTAAATNIYSYSWKQIQFLFIYRASLGWGCGMGNGWEILFLCDTFRSALRQPLPEKSTDNNNLWHLCKKRANKCSNFGVAYKAAGLSTCNVTCTEKNCKSIGEK